MTGKAKNVLCGVVAALCAAGAPATASANGWEGSFANGLEGWKTLNYNKVAALSVEKFAGERAFVVRHSVTNAKNGTAWEIAQSGSRRAGRTLRGIRNVMESSKE